MANIKLKDLLKEVAAAGGMVSNNPWLKEDDDTPKVNVRELVSSINNYGSLGENIYGKGSLKEVAEQLSAIAEGAAQHTLSEADDMFDKVTISRNMKELKGLSGQFGKVAKEANSLQERMSGLYEDMGNILSRYYTIGEKHVPGHDDEDSEANEGKDMLFREGDDYKQFFKKAMKKFGISSPKDLKPEDEKDFYDYVDRNYKAKNEVKEYGMLKLKDLINEGYREAKDEGGVRLAQAIHNNVDHIYELVIQDGKDPKEVMRAFEKPLKNSIKVGITHKYKPHPKADGADAKIKTFQSELKKFQKIADAVASKPSKAAIKRMKDAYRTIWNRKFGAEIALGGKLYHTIIA